MSIDMRKLTREEADKQAVLDHAFKGASLDADVVERIHERAQAIRAKLPPTNVAVGLVREIRDDE